MFFQMANSLSSSFSSLIQIVPAAINAATCAGRLMAVSELEKERYLDMDQVEEIQKDERKEIAIRLKNINISYKTGKDIIHRGDFSAEAGEITAIIGPSGEGKTTTSAKLIQYYKEQGKKVAVAAADTFRAGAIDQIDTWATRLGVHCVKGKMNQDPSSVLVDACRYAKENDIDILICDTAGRLQNKTNLMNELSKMHRVVQREIEGAPQEVWLVLDATTGQNGISQAKVFLEATDVTGIVLTKMDGTAKGGVVLAIRDLLHLPVRFLGLGEKPADLRPFDINAFLMGITKGMEE